MSVSITSLVMTGGFNYERKGVPFQQRSSVDGLIPNLEGQSGRWSDSVYRQGTVTLHWSSLHIVKIWLCKFLIRNKNERERWRELPCIWCSSISCRLDGLSSSDPEMEWFTSLRSSWQVLCDRTSSSFSLGWYNWVTLNPPINNLVDRDELDHVFRTFSP